MEGKICLGSSWTMNWEKILTCFDIHLQCLSHLYQAVTSLWTLSMRQGLATLVNLFHPWRCLTVNKSFPQIYDVFITGISPECSLEGLMLKLKLQYFGHLMWRADSLEKTLMLGDWRQEEKGTTEDEMVGWHRRLNRHEFEWTPGDSGGQESLVCCSLQGHKDTTEQLN